MKSILFEMPKQGYEQLRIIDRQQNAHKQTKIDSFFRPKTPTLTTTIQSPRHLHKNTINNIKNKPNILGNVDNQS